MIQPNQTLTIMRIADYLRHGSWDILYIDYPGASRGGTGIRQTVFLTLEELKSPTPDIVAVNSGELRVIEVNKSLAHEISNFERHATFKEKLVRQLSERLGLGLRTVTYGFGRTGVVTDIRRAVFPKFSFAPVLYFYYLDSSLSVHEVILEADPTKGASTSGSS